MANRNNAFVRQGPGAAATGSSGRTSSTAAGSPTPERSCIGTRTEISPSTLLICGMPLSASLMRSRSPGSWVPIRLCEVE